MFISREYDYAIRVMRALAGRSRLTVGQICEAEQIPQPYAYKILKKLERAGLLAGYRGTLGGYELAAELGAVNLYNIYTAVEGELCLNECMQAGYACPRNQGPGCGMHRTLVDLQKQFVELLKQRNLGAIF